MNALCVVCVVIANSQAHSSPQSARQMGIASIVFSVIGIVIGIIITIILIVLFAIGVDTVSNSHMLIYNLLEVVLHSSPSVDEHD